MFVDVPKTLHTGLDVPQQLVRIYHSTAGVFHIPILGDFRGHHTVLQLVLLQGLPGT